MSIDRGLDFLGMHLQSADIDDSILAADEVIALAAPFHDVAGVDEALTVRERGNVGSDIAGRRSRRAQPQRGAHDLDVDIAIAVIDEMRGKAFEAVIHLEADARLGRRIGVAETSLRIDRAQIVEHRLVRDFAGQADIARRDRPRRRPHQDAPPMGRRA